METAWYSFLSVDIIATATSDNIFVNKSGGGIKGSPISTGCCCNNIHGEKAIPGCFHPVFQPLPAMWLKIGFLAILSPFAPAYGRPLDPTSAFIDKNVITDCYGSDIHGEKAIQGYFHPISPPFAKKLNFWPFTPVCAPPWATPWHFFIFF